jgi:3D (Asp-Asp-Asp) domain-containing protein
MKRTWTVILGTATLLGALCLPAAAAESPAQSPATVSVSSAGFSDVPSWHWAYAPIMQLRAAGVIAAAPTGQFQPDAPIRRAELLKLVLAARGIDPGKACTGVLADVDCSAWYGPYAEAAYRMAIVEADDGYLAPRATVTRQEMFTLIIRAMGRRWTAANMGYAEIAEQLSGFKDRGDIADWAAPSVALAVEKGLATGNDDRRFRPQDLATRAEAAAAVARILVDRTDGGQSKVDGHSVVYVDAVDVVASAFNADEPGLDTQTYTGVSARVGVVAVDPDVIPLGRLLYVEGYGYAVAADTGSAILGHRVDLYVADLQEALDGFGMQPRRVYVLP